MCVGTDCEDDDLDVRRRSFLVGGMAALAGVALASTAGAQTPSEPPPTRVMDDPTVEKGGVTFRSGDEEIDGYLARPRAAGKRPAVLVIAGNRITEEYIQNTCVALAVAGYVGLAPNVYHTVPDSAQTVAEMNRALEGRPEEDFGRDIRAGALYLQGHEAVKPGRLGILGFCVGGRRALLYADHDPDVKAVLPFYPGKMEAREMTHIKAPVQIHSGTADRSVPVSDIREVERALKAQGTPVKVYLYEGVDHGFLAYTRPTYRADAAVLAWKRAVTFLHRHLKR